jgi:hypothetical protein
MTYTSHHHAQGYTLALQPEPGIEVRVVTFDLDVPVEVIEGVTYLLDEVCADPLVTTIGAAQVLFTALLIVEAVPD